MARSRPDHLGRYDVAVTGIGLVTPAGIGVEENWQRILSGVSTARPGPDLGGAGSGISCQVEYFDADAVLGRELSWRLDRFVQLALGASRAALADAGLDTHSWDGARVGVVMANSLGGSGTFEKQHQRMLAGGPRRVSPMLIPMSMMNMVSGYVAMDCGAGGPNLVTASACASGASAIGTGRAMLRSGECDIVIAGASESALSGAVLSGLGALGALSGRTQDPAGASRPFDVERDGFVPGEAAGVLILERPQDARGRGARIRANISGYAATADAYHATAPDPSGAGVERAIREALSDAGISAEEVTHVNAHGTSTPLNDLVEGQVLHRVFGSGAAVTSTKGVTGHTLGAAGAIEAAYAVLAVENGEIPPTANLSEIDPEIRIDVVTGVPRKEKIEVATTNSFGFGGHNAVLVVTAA